MHHYWLKQNSNTKLILFFCGWGSDYHPFIPIPSIQYDLLIFYDYTDLELPINLSALFEKYEEVSLIGWSLGVWVAEAVCSHFTLKFSTAIAINGTLNPIDDKEGISSDVFQRTLLNLSDENMKKFNKRMFRKVAERILFEQNSPQRQTEELKVELAFLKDKITPSFKSLFGKALVGSEDLIFLPENQLRYWHGKAHVTEKSVPHFPFYAFSSWDTLIEETNSYNG